jgi:pyruvate formate lyase activating enzyme
MASIEKLHEASFYKKADSKVRCELCPRFCTIVNQGRGNCGVRQNIDGTLYSMVYGRPCSVALDPIEKKPFYHFLPGKDALSIATAGCNLHCMYCQNWTISQSKPEDVSSLHMPPEKVIETARNSEAKIISYTYTEPTIFYEYMHDIAVLAKKEKMRNTIVSNGFINPKPLKNIVPLIDAANIDLKGDAEFYRKITFSFIEPVLEALKIYKKKKVWLEITNLIIPTLNDSPKQIKWLASWIKENLGRDTPLHFSAFWPTYKLKHLPPTSVESLKRARLIAMSEGLNYVYTGNVDDEEGSTTFCPKCKKALIKRRGFYTYELNIRNGKCKFCRKAIAGVWK